MFRRTVLTFAFAAAATAAPSSAGIPGTMSPAEAVAAATQSPKFGKQGSFAMLVKATGTSHGHTYLNSELDYRDPRNLSIDIDSTATKLLTRELGSSPADFYKGRFIVVRGTARRVPIKVSDDKGPLGIYFQTHVPVRLLSQISVVNAPAAP